MNDQLYHQRIEELYELNEQVKRVRASAESSARFELDQALLHIGLAIKYTEADYKRKKSVSKTGDK